MDNRRPAGGSPDKPFSRGSYYKKTGDNSYGQKTFQPRESRFQPSDQQSAPRRDDKFAPRDDKPQSRDEKFPPRDNKFQPRANNSGGRFQRRDERNDNRNDKFRPGKNFIPRGGAKPVPLWKREERPRIYDEMQITDGKHIGKFLKSTDSPKVRPTARRIRETLFKLIFRRVRAGRFLDLCAGSGTVGIEAVSRGALVCSFVERSAKMCGIIKKNLETIGIKEGHGEVFETEAVPFLKQMAKRRRFWDVVFFDPPYDTDYDEILSYLSRGVGIKLHGTLVIEHHAEMFFPERLGVLQRWRVIVLGESALSFYERR
ncbi:MAG: 16S rRNA (guanine(966)-N(2))-methyltransferase RsmD [Pyrinomonadaceae bacterium]